MMIFVTMCIQRKRLFILLYEKKEKYTPIACILVEVFLYIHGDIMNIYIATTEKKYICSTVSPVYFYLPPKIKSYVVIALQPIPVCD